MRMLPRLLLRLSCVLLLAACGTPAAVRIEPSAPPSAARLSSDEHPTPVSTSAAQHLSADAITPSHEPHADAGADDPALLRAIHAALAPDLDHYSVVVRRLHDGQGVALNAEREHYAASLFKLALLFEAARQRSLGELNFDGAVQVTDEDVAEDLGTLGSLELGADGLLPVRAAVQAMVTRSDNTSAVALLRTLDARRVDRTLAALGLRHTSVNTQALPTTAADMALLMEAIARGWGIDPAWREEMLGLLLRQKTRHGIPRLLPAGVRVGNKTGTWPGATHDVAFVDAPGGLYVIAVLSDRSWDWEPIARVSRAVYDVLAR